MNTFKFLTVAALSSIFVSCSDSKSTVDTGNKEQTKTEAQQNNDFSTGMYTATLPCADCMEIETYITFQKDNKAVKSTSYLDSDGTSENEYGTWTKNDDIIEVSIPNSDEPFSAFFGECNLQFECVTYFFKICSNSKGSIS